jgi:hypothetical protein
MIWGKNSNDQFISDGDDSVDKEYAAAMSTRQRASNNNSKTSRTSIRDDNQENDDDNAGPVGTSGTESSNKMIIQDNKMNTNNDVKPVIKHNSSIYVTAGIENYNDSIDEILSQKSQSNARRRMNVIILFPDDWRHDSIGAENPIIRTPYLDSLAKEGIRFRQNAVTTSICWQSRATLFSGQWASRHRSYKLRCPHFTVGKAWNKTWPAILRRDGYFIGHIGKWQYHNSDLSGTRFDWTSFFEGRNNDGYIFICYLCFTYFILTLELVRHIISLHDIRRTLVSSR